MSDPLGGIPTWIWSAVVGLFTGAASGGIAYGRTTSQIAMLKEKIEFAEASIDRKYDSLREDIAMLRADVREAINRGPMCSNFHPRDRRGG